MSRAQTSPFPSAGTVATGPLTAVLHQRSLDGVSHVGHLRDVGPGVDGLGHAILGQDEPGVDLEDGLKRFLDWADKAYTGKA